MGEGIIGRLYGLIQQLEKDENSGPFLFPVNYEELKLLDYPLVIKRPMDLSTVKVMELSKNRKNSKQVNTNLMKRP